MAPQSIMADVSAAFRAHSLALLLVCTALLFAGTNAAGDCLACYQESEFDPKFCNDGSISIPGTSGNGAATCEDGSCDAGCGAPTVVKTPNAPLSTVTTQVTCGCGGSQPGGNGDPHFEGPQGIKYDFHGVGDKDFCLISDARFHMNSHFIGQETEQTGVAGTWMDSFFLLYNADESGTEHTLKIAVSERPSIAHSSNVTVFFDSEPILSQETAFVGAGGDTWHAADESCHVAHLKTKKGADGVRVEIPGVVEMEIEVQPHRFPDGVHLDFSIESLRMTPNMHGVLGQMFQAGRPQQFKAAGRVGGNGEGIVDGSYRDYQTSDLASPDCKFTQYFRTFEAPGGNQPGSRVGRTSRKLLSVEDTLTVVGGFACRHESNGALICAAQ